ncbi:MAG: NAD(P)-dependent oxidoreductase [Bryobacterales bacterium]|nr:NAD(P)-dependent oxidoreductase [Bryobacterales bacterium]
MAAQPAAQDRVQTVTIQDERQLEDLMSQPGPGDIQVMTDLEGDLLILGVGGKMGPSLARRAKRANPARRVMAVSRFSSPGLREALESDGIETHSAELMDAAALARLPEAPNVIFMAGRKFGSTGAEWLTWAMNTYLPGMVAERYRHSRIVAFSSGNVYPLVPVKSGGATEATPPEPVGEYAQSVLGRERMFQHFSCIYGTPVTLLRLNYAIDLRYGVLLDVGRKVFERRPVDLRMGHANVIWQGDANSICLRAFAICQSPPAIVNVTGPETVSIRWAAERFGACFGIEPVFEGVEADTALLNNASRCHRLFGYPSVTLEQMIEWTAEWIRGGGPTLNKPTHFETRDGRF